MNCPGMKPAQEGTMSELVIPWLTSVRIGNSAISGSILFAILCAIVAASKGRSAIGWALIGFIANCIGFIILICLEDLNEGKKSDASWDRMDRKTRRLKESLRQERVRAETFRSQVEGRLDAHDMAIGIDTRGIQEPLDRPALAPDPSEIPCWYYEDGGHQAGPVSRAALLALVTAGAVTPTTLVWCEGMEDWKPFGEIGELPPPVA